MTLKGTSVYANTSSYQEKGSMMKLSRQVLALSTAFLVLIMSGVLVAGAVGAHAYVAQNTTATVAVDTNTVVRSVNPDLFAGVNTANWSRLSTPEYTALMQETGLKAFRYPGGDISNEWNWQTNVSAKDGGNAVEPWPNFVNWSQTAGGNNLILTVNYGSSTAQVAADWVRDANINRHLGVKYWEIGNELYGVGLWEYDTKNTTPQSYAVGYKEYSAAMKAVDPGIKTGVSIGFDGFQGFTDQLLPALAANNVVPDFVIIHPYAGVDGNDSSLLNGEGSRVAGWMGKIRQELQSNFGAQAASIEVVDSEINTAGSNIGKDTTSIVNGLYLTTTMGEQLQYPEIKTVDWFMYDGTNNPYQPVALSTSSSPYGWRSNADYGIVQRYTHDRYPTYYTAKLLKKFLHGANAQVIKVSSSISSLGAYAVKYSDGSLALLVINRSANTSTDATFALTGYTASGNASVYSYGLANDTANQTGVGNTDLDTSALAVSGSSFTTTFTPYSATVIVLNGPQVDLARPQAPVLSISNQTSNSVGLSWSGASDNAGIKRYDIYVHDPNVGTGTGYYRLAGTTTGTSYTVRGLIPNTAYSFAVKTVDTSYNSSLPSNKLTTTTNPPGLNSPRSGTPVALPAVIGAENYDLGGEGVGYHDTTLGNTNEVPLDDRQWEGVDIETSTEGGYDVSWTGGGEWLAYTVKVPSTSSLYTLTVRAANGIANNTFTIHVEANGTNVTGTINVPFTGGWQNFRDFTIANVSLTAGVQTLKVVQESGGANIKSVLVNGGCSGTPTSPPSAPTNLNVQSVASTSVVLSWGSALDCWPVTGYDVFSGATKVASVNGTTTTAQVSGLLSNTAYTFTVKAHDSTNAYSPASNAVTVTTLPPSTPYSGTPIAVPGQIEAENYDKGGEGVAYHSITTPLHNSTGFRTSEGVDLESCTDTSGCGYDVPWNTSGEWEKYTISATSAGSYNIVLRVASASGTNPAVHVEIDDVNVTGTVQLPITGGWQTWTDVTLGSTNLTAGTHVLKVVWESDGVNLNFIKVTPVSTVPSTPYFGTPINVPGQIEAENYDKGGEGVAYHNIDNPSHNSTGFRTSEGVDLESCTDTSGCGYDVPWNHAGEWQKYTINVTSAGTYSLTLRVASAWTGGNPKAHLNIDGVNVSGTLTLPNTGSWQTWQNAVVQNISLTAGTHVLQVAWESDGVNLNWISFTQTASSGSLPTPWADKDIGSVGQTGSATYSSGTFTVKGSGADIWNTSDAFNYVYQTLNGNGQIIAHVTGVQNTNSWAKAGVMIRATLDANSAYAAMLLTPGNGTAFQRRTSTGAFSTHTGGSGSAPYWVKLVRSGNTLTGYVSSDGTTWTQVGSDTIAMSSTVYIGLALTSHDNSVLNTTTFDQVSVS